MLTRREALLRCANGFGGLALSALLAEAAPANERALDPMKVRPPHYQPKAASRCRSKDRSTSGPLVQFCSARRSNSSGMGAAERQ
jgi:hypothetical protein